MDQPFPVLDFYKKRVRELGADLAETSAHRSQTAGALIILCFVGVVLLYLAVSRTNLPFWTLGLLAPVAWFVIKRFSEHRRKALKLLALLEYYENGIARLELKWESLDTGSEFNDPQHFYATDLDLFGRGSLFQVLCSARTKIGRETVANWMKFPASEDELVARRIAISELRPNKSLRENLASAGRSSVSDCRTQTFRDWVQASVQGPFPTWAAPTAFLLALILCTLPFLYWFGPLTPQQLWRSLSLAVVLEIGFAAIFKSRVRRLLESLNLLSMELPLVCELLRIIETGHFSSPKLASFSAMLKPEGVPASELSGKLRTLLRLLYERDNDFFAPISWCLLWGSQFSMAIDRWRRRYGNELLKWLDVLGEFEALVSISTYANEHPEHSMPEIVNAGRPLFEAEELGHPLLPRDVCVRNDFHLTENVRFVIVSGSNMSGKSTFLRAIGVNAVLAWMGAPVCCKSLRMSQLSVSTSIRVADSLQDGRSHFLAEMQRLRRMIDCADQGPLLFLADEIMSGTNSHDRRIATEWVIQALVARNAIGLITTHDLALTEIASSGLPGRNAYFEDTGEAGNLVFDYKLRPGILTHSNALNIAHALGIDAAALRSK